MSYIVVAQSTYESIEVALYKGDKLISSMVEDKHSSSKLLVPALSILLQKNSCTLDEIRAIGVNCGPAPFTTLRVLLATVNGVGFAKKIPLISLDGLSLFLNEFSHPECDYTVALFNAYNNDAYFGIKGKDGVIKTGYKNIITLCDEFQILCKNSKICFVGAGLDVFRSYIASIKGIGVCIDESYPRDGSLTYLFHETQRIISTSKNITYEVFPLYLKELSYKKAI